jgi:type IV fimbrial biogenesis protein FimT
LEVEMKARNVLPAQTRANARSQRGLTLIESCVVACIAAVLVGSGVPSFKDSLQRRTLDGVALEALTDLHFARSESVSRNQRLRISYLGATDGARCMIVHTGAAADCTCGPQGVAQCTADVNVIKAKSYGVGDAASVSANVSHMVIDPVRGTFSPAGQIRATLADGTEIRHVVTPHGRIRSCSPEAKVKGYAAC